MVNILNILVNFNDDLKINFNRYFLYAIKYHFNRKKKWDDFKKKRWREGEKYIIFILEKKIDKKKFSWFFLILFLWKLQIKEI
tara:strand:+ start:9871 stop:10119 length:249 start_codon:yes stop_codon:yes gene_type:complete